MKKLNLAANIYAFFFSENENSIHHDKLVGYQTDHTRGGATGGQGGECPPMIFRVIKKRGKRRKRRKRGGRRKKREEKRGLGLATI